MFIEEIYKIEIKKPYGVTCIEVLLYYLPIS